MPQPLTDAINALTTYSNSVTGASDTTLSDAVATLASGYGGGGSSPITLLETVTVPSDSRTFNFDMTPYANYDVVIVNEHVELSESDWLYYVRNGSAPSAGTYNDGSKQIHTGIVFWKLKLGGSTRVISACPANNSYSLSNDGQNTTNYFIYTYTASKYIKAGSYFNVYVGNTSDM